MQHALPRFATIPWARGFAALLFVLTVAVVVLDVIVWGGQRFRPPPVSFIRGQGVLVIEMFMAVSYAAMGWLLATRLARNPLGWIFLLIGLAMALQMMATFLVQAGHESFRPLQPLALWGAWLSSSVHLPLTIALFVLVFLLFPDGRPLSSRWARAGWLSGLGAGLVIVAAGLSPAGLTWFPSLPNPLAAPIAVAPVLTAVGMAGLSLVVVGTLIAAFSMVVRYRRAGEVQRAQLRWIAVAVVLLAGGGLPFVVSRYALQMDYASGEVLLLVAVGAGCFLPVAAAVAVLRHRLYDIDLIINRALVYIPLTGIVGGLYTAGVALSQRVFVALTGERSDAAIIITTLVLASMFTNLRNWLQGMVDRRWKPAPRSEPVPAPAASPTTAFGGTTVDELSARVAQLEQHLGLHRPSGPPSSAHTEPAPLHTDRSGLCSPTQPPPREGEPMQIDDNTDETYEPMPEWVRLGRDVPQLWNAPFRLYFKTFSSSSDEAEAFIHDPLTFCRGEPVRGYEEVKGAVLEGLNEETHVVTLVTNHERTLQRRIIYTLAVVDDQKNTTTFTIYKQDADS